MKKLTVLFLTMITGTQALAQQDNKFYFPYEEHPGLFIALSHRTSDNIKIKTVLDSMGIIIESSFPYCNGKGPEPDINTFIVRAAAGKAFPLEYLRKRFIYNGTIDPLITEKGVKEIKDIYGSNAKGMSPMVQFVTIPEATAEEVKALAEKYNLELQPGHSYSHHNRKVWEAKAYASTGHSLSGIARKLSVEKQVVSVQVMISALNCPCK